MAHYEAMKLEQQRKLFTDRNRLVMFSNLKIRQVAMELPSALVSAGKLSSMLSQKTPKILVSFHCFQEESLLRS
jgi:hypothetical protein